jgi:hypothetical protein
MALEIVTAGSQVAPPSVLRWRSIWSPVVVNVVLLR